MYIFVTIVIVVCVVIYGLISWCSYYVDKIIFELPWMQWLTMDDLIEKGYSEGWSSLALSVLYDAGNLDVRVKKYYAIYDVGEFDVDTAEYYEFRLTSRKQWRKRGVQKMVMKLSTRQLPA